MFVLNGVQLDDKGRRQVPTVAYMATVVMAIALLSELWLLIKIASLQSSLSCFR